MSGPRFKAWYIPQLPMKAFEVECATADEAKRLVDVITDFSIFEYENNVKPDYCDMAGVLEWDEGEQEWFDYEPPADCCDNDDCDGDDCLDRAEQAREDAAIDRADAERKERGMS